MAGRRCMQAWYACVLIVLLGGPPLHAAEPSPPKPADRDGIEFFEKRIRPVLAEHCYRCHSAKAETVEAGLYVDSREGLLEGGDQGPAIVPGDPAASLLIDAVKYETDDLKMPPDRKLAEEQIADLVKWVERGAPAPPSSNKTARDRALPTHGSQDVRRRESRRHARSVMPRAFPLNPEFQQGG